MNLSDVYWTGTLITGLLLIWKFGQQVRMLGSVRMVLELMDLAHQVKGEDRFWFSRPDEDSAKRMLLLIVLIASLTWPVTWVMVLWDDE